MQLINNKKLYLLNYFKVVTDQGYFIVIAEKIT